MEPLQTCLDQAYAQLAAVQPPELDRVMLFGFLSAFAAALCQLHVAREEQGRLPMAICALALSVYGFLVGAWPLGLVEAAASIMQFGQWVNRRWSHARRESYAVPNRFMQLFGDPGGGRRPYRAQDDGLDGHEN